MSRFFKRITSLLFPSRWEAQKPLWGGENKIYLFNSKSRKTMNGELCKYCCGNIIKSELHEMCELDRKLSSESVGNKTMLIKLELEQDFRENTLSFASAKQIC